MPPHRALTVPDVLHEVFQYFATYLWLTTPGVEMVASESLVPGRRPKESEADVKAKRLTLARAARTCKAFAEPGSRVLWAVQDGLGPIVTVLKNSRILGSEDAACDWARFEHIARRVRMLCTQGDDGLSPGDDTLELIYARYVDRAIFPNLRALVLNWSHRPLDAPLLRCLCASPALLLVNNGERDATIAQSLAVISDMHPELIHLHTPLLTHLDDNGNRAFANFNNLHTAEFRRIDDALFVHLATLPRLKILCGAFAISDPEVDVETTFPVLQELIADGLDQGDGEVDCLAALPYISSPSLALFSIRVIIYPGEDLLEYLDELCEAPALAHLRDIDLNIIVGSDRPYENQGRPNEGEDEEEDEEDDESVNFADVLSRLQRMRELKAITVFVASMVPAFSLQDRDLEAIAGTWPELVRLEIGFLFQDVGHDPWDGPRSISWPSFGAIVSLAERCRKLETIDVEFENVDARALEELEARAAACEAPQTALRRIIVGPGVTKFCQRLSLTDPVRVAAALRKLFPNLEGGLETIGVDSEAEESSSVVGCRRVWDPSDMKTDMFRLIKALEDSHLDG